jgi:hypothetical protein
MDALALEFRPADALVVYENNARVHSVEQIGQIQRSMLEFGWTNPVLVDEAGRVIAGHGRLEAARGLWGSGKTIPRTPTGQVPVVVLTGLSDAQRRALILADNQIALNAGWDIGKLKLEIGELSLAGFDLGLLGFDQQFLHDMLADPEPARDPDDAPALETAAISQPGDVWVLGEHRVICGDSTSIDVWQKLLQGESLDAVWTDPPYNVAYEGTAGSIKNDDLPDAAFRELLDGAFRCLWACMAPGAPIYVAHADTEGLAFRAAFVSAGLKLSGCLIWRKNSLVLGRSDYQWMHEPILYGWKPGRRHPWYGGRKQTTVADYGGPPFRQMDDGSWVVEVGDQVLRVSGEAAVDTSLSSLLRHEKPKRSAEHPTMKPTGLIEKMLRSSCRAGRLVGDAFGGSGSTLIAAHRLGMRARLVELDPLYCDVIVRRWQEFTGGTGILEGTGAPFPSPGLVTGVVKGQGAVDQGQGVG